MIKVILALFLFIVANCAYSASSTYIKGPSLVKSSMALASSGIDTSLTSTSSMVITITGTNSHGIVLPNTSLIPPGTNFEVINGSTGIVTVKSFSGARLRTLRTGESITFILLDSLAWSYDNFSGSAYAGAILDPSYTDNGSGNITVQASRANLWDNSTFVGSAKPYDLASITATLTDNATSYVIADYNAGSPIMRITTDVNEITESNIIPLFTIYRNGSMLHSLPWDTLGNGLANKIHQSIVKTQRYRRESGLILSESGTRNLNLTAGAMRVGANPINLLSMATLTDNMFYFLRTASSTWTMQTVTQYNNTDYFNGTTTASVSNNRYVVNWIYRGVETQKHLYSVIGEGDYTLAQAQASQPPSSLPGNITSHGLLVGRIIVLKGASVATQIDSAFSVVFTQSASAIHNDLGGLQGGAASEYYHLTQAKYNAVENLTASGTQANFSGNIQVPTSSCVYNGDSVTNGSYRTCQVGGAFIVSKLKLGSWVEVYRIE